MEECMVSELSNKCQVKLAAKNIVLWSLRTRFMHLRVNLNTGKNGTKNFKFKQLLYSSTNRDLFRLYQISV